MPVQLCVSTDGADLELVSDHLWALGAVAVVEDGATLRAGFDDDGSARAALVRIGRRWACELQPVDVSNQEWRQVAEPVRVGRLLVALPEHLAHVITDAHVVVVTIEPGRAFGSGGHPTTRQCLMALEALVAPGDSVLDLGSGSGVLAVAAALLGAGPVVAVDNDPVAREATAANASANAVSVTVVEALPQDRFDLVVCNLGGSRAVVELAQGLAPTVAAGGRLVVAGLLAGANEVPDDTFPGLELEGRADLEGWFSLTFRRPA